jgi:hypothetical protein
VPFRRHFVARAPPPWRSPWYGVDGSAIRVEITERSLLAPSPIVIESLGRNMVEAWYDPVSPLAFWAYSPLAAAVAELQLTGR